jgi:hypothetical protein
MTNTLKNGEIDQLIGHMPGNRSITKQPLPPLGSFEAAARMGAFARSTSRPFSLISTTFRMIDDLREGTLLFCKKAAKNFHESGFGALRCQRSGPDS